MTTVTGTKEVPLRTKPQDQTAAVTPVRTRRSVFWLAGAVALILAGAVAGAFVYTSASNTVPVFAVSHEIARGDTINKSDLTTIDLAAGQQTQGIPIKDSSDVIGKIASVDLPTGAMVTRDALTNSLTVPSGKALVGLTLKPSQMPAQRLVAGDEVVIVPVAVEGAAGQATISAAKAVTGTVSSVSAPGPNSGSGATTTIDVYVSDPVAADVTSRAAGGQVAIYLAPVKG